MEAQWRRSAQSISELYVLVLNFHIERINVRVSLVIDLHPVIAKDGVDGRIFRQVQAISSNSTLTCTTTQVGSAIYCGADTTIIVLREQIRNLKWYSSAQMAEQSNCSAGTVFIVPASVDLSIDWPDSIEIIIMQPEEHLLRETFCLEPRFYEINGTRNVEKISCKESISLSHLIWDEVCRRGGQDKPYLTALSLVLMRTLAHIALNDRVSSDNKAGLSKSACQQIEAYLSQNFHKALSVPDMAALVGISAGHFSTCFRNSFGQTPHQYLMGLRLDEAERRLRKTVEPISEIARLLNFSSQSHLTTALRKHRQLTPGELRK